MKQLPSRFRRLDDALADLPLDEPMLLTELDGFLTGVLVGPEPIPQDEWLQNVWGSDENGIAPFEDPLDLRWFVDAVTARYDEIVRDLTRGRLKPILDVDERNGETLWAYWIGGFAEATDLRADGWAGLRGDDDPRVAGAAARLAMLIAIARDESMLDSVQINAIEDEAPAMMIDAVLCLHAARLHRGDAPAATPIGAGAGAGAARVGRNDPCPCGSGKKSKRCCG